MEIESIGGPFKRKKPMTSTEKDIAIFMLLALQLLVVALSDRKN